jgi:uncharacterized protein RhaS with RHS repeats
MQQTATCNQLSASLSIPPEPSGSYYRARYYDPSTGRFLSEDPLGVQDNIDMYVYVGNNAATYQDFWGLYTLKGFTPDQQVRMNNAINDAISKLRVSCPSWRVAGT